MAANAGFPLWVDWGDNTDQAWVCDGTEKTVLKEYAAPGTYTVKVSGPNIHGVTSFDIADQTICTAHVDIFFDAHNLVKLSLIGTGFHNSASGIDALNKLETLTLPTTVSGVLSYIEDTTTLETLIIKDASWTGDLSSLDDLDSLVYCDLSGNSLDFTDCPLPAWPGIFLDVSDNALSETEVNNLINRLAHDCGASGTVIGDGTNAYITPVCYPGKATLEAAGWTVTMNDRTYLIDSTGDYCVDSNDYYGYIS